MRKTNIFLEEKVKPIYHQHRSIFWIITIILAIQGFVSIISNLFNIGFIDTIKLLVPIGFSVYLAHKNQEKEEFKKYVSIIENCLNLVSDIEAAYMGMETAYIMQSTSDLELLNREIHTKAILLSNQLFIIQKPYDSLQNIINSNCAEIIEGFENPTIISNFESYVYDIKQKIRDLYKTTYKIDEEVVSKYSLPFENSNTIPDLLIGTWKNSNQKLKIESNAIMINTNNESTIYPVNEVHYQKCEEFDMYFDMYIVYWDMQRVNAQRTDQMIGAQPFQIFIKSGNTTEIFLDSPTHEPLIRE